MPSYTRTIALEQNGSSIGGVWTEFPLGGFITVQVGGFVGLVYNVQLTGGSPFTLTTETVPRGIDPPIWIGGGTVTFVGQGFFGGDLSIYLVPEPSPDLFSSANPPATTSALLLQRTVVGSILGTSDPVTFTAAADDTIRSQATSRVTWTGRVALVLDWQIAGASTLGVSSLVASTFQTFWSGAMGGPSGPRRRFVRDHRYGMPALNNELVRDGDQPGLWVRPWDADPLDEPNTYRPRPDEGTVTDEIGDL